VKPPASGTIISNHVVEHSTINYFEMYNDWLWYYYSY